MSKHKLFLSLAVLTLLVAPSLAQTKKDKEVRFTVRVENVSNADGQTASNGAKWPFALSPGLLYSLKKRGEHARNVKEARPAERLARFAGYA